MDFSCLSPAFTGMTGFRMAAKFLGPAQFIPSFAGFRPFLGPISSSHQLILRSDSMEIFALLDSLLPDFLRGLLQSKFARVINSNPDYIPAPSGLSLAIVSIGGLLHTLTRMDSVDLLFAFIGFTARALRRSKRRVGQFDHKHASAHCRGLPH